MILEVTVSTAQFETAIAERAEEIIAALRAQMQATVINTLAYIKDNKLSGQLLNQRTGNLKNSGFTEVAEDSTTLTGTIGFGRTVPYAAIHNYGGTISIPAVEGKLMVFERAGDTVFTMRHKAFTVTMPERNYLESSLEELEPEIREGFVAAIEGAAHA